MKIGILGGTFDPIHNGHLLLARAAKKQFDLDRVLFIPAFIPPHKTQRADISPARLRYRMTELAIQSEPGFEMCDLEIRRQGVSYTVDTVHELKKNDPGAELFLILGADAFSGLQTWHEPEEICKQVIFLVANRPGFQRAETGFAKVRWIEMPDVFISASQIREDIRQGRKVAPLAVPAAVEKFARELKLYRTDRS